MIFDFAMMSMNVPPREEEQEVRAGKEQRPGTNLLREGVRFHEDTQVTGQWKVNNPSPSFAKLATTPSSRSMAEMDEPEDWTKLRLERVRSNQDQPPRDWQATVERLERQIEALKVGQVSSDHNRLSPHSATSFQPPNRPPARSLLEDSVIRMAQKRLKFDIKDVHGSIEMWDHFFEVYEVESDFEKFYAVEPLIPSHIQRVFKSSGTWEKSYYWLVSYLKQKYKANYLCHELGNRPVTGKSNLDELEDLANQAAMCPREHQVKHYMLVGCSVTLKHRMKPYMLLPMEEFKFKLKMMALEESSGKNRYNVNVVNESGDKDAKVQGNEMA